MKKEKKCLFDSSMSMDEVQKRLEIPGAEVCQAGGRKCLVKYGGGHFVVSREKDGYRASVDIPGYLFWVLLVLCFIVIFYLRGGFDILQSSSESIVSLVGVCLGGALIPSFVLYWIIAEVYSASKKHILMDFCNKVSSV